MQLAGRVHFSASDAVMGNGQKGSPSCTAGSCATCQDSSQDALKKQNLPCTFLAHHEPEGIVTIANTITTASAERLV